METKGKMAKGKKGGGVVGWRGCWGGGRLGVLGGLAPSMCLRPRKMGIRLWSAVKK